MIKTKINKPNNWNQLWDIGKNSIYIFKEGFSTCKLFFSFYVIIMAVIDVIDSILLIILYKYLIDCINREAEFGDVVTVLLLLGGGCGLFTIVARSLLSRSYEIKILRVAKKINKKLFEKSVIMDIYNYDNEDYYNNYVRAMDNSEVQAAAALKTGAGMISTLMSISSLTGILLLVDPVMFLFPILASLVHLFSNLGLTRIRYDLQREVTPLSRRKAYCRRVFYQPEYSKEMRLTDMYKVHSHFYEETTTKEVACERKYAKKIRMIKIFNCIVGWVALVYYLPMQYLIYNSIVTAKLALGDVAAMNESNQSLINSIDGLTNNMVGIQEIGLFGGYYKKFLESKCEIETRKGIRNFNRDPKVIEFRNVSFSYDGSTDYVLKNINMKIVPGQKIAIVGYNGSGKSTLIKLLLNLYSATSGTIFYDGKAVEDYECANYRENFGILFQDFQTYALSICENISMGESTCENKQEAMELAQISELINSMPNKDESVLTQEFDEKGILLSGGESQRLALSRLYVKNSPIIILDEHTSAMDPMTEKEVNDTIFSRFSQNTIIYVSHHLTSVCNADYIYFLDNGKIVESGTHQELIILNKSYRTMFEKQSCYYTA